MLKANEAYLQCGIRFKSDSTDWDLFAAEFIVNAAAVIAAVDGYLCELFIATDDVEP